MAQNISLLYTVVPELEDLVKRIWTDGLGGPVAVDALGSLEARTRFENLMVDIVSELSASRMLTLVSRDARLRILQRLFTNEWVQYLDDIQNADGQSLSLIEAFARARVNVLILGTLRNNHQYVRMIVFSQVDSYIRFLVRLRTDLHLFLDRV
jgi:predicted ATPase